jgi:hypothetical protein
MLQNKQPANILAATDFNIDLSLIFFKNDLMYWHNVMRINYTTYDVQQA